MLTEKIKPEEAMIFARSAVHAEVEVRRHAKRGQNMPGRGDKEKDEDHSDRTQAPPSVSRKKLAREQQVDQRSADRDYKRDQPFEQRAYAQSDAKNGWPSARVDLSSVFIQGVLECHETDRNGQGKHDVGNKNAGKKKESDRCGQCESCVKTGAASKGPRSISGCDKTQQHRCKGSGNTGQIGRAHG